MDVLIPFVGDLGPFMLVLLPFEDGEDVFFEILLPACSYEGDVVFFFILFDGETLDWDAFLRMVSDCLCSSYSRSLKGSLVTDEDFYPVSPFAAL